ncbi:MULTISPECIES: hypothetical protein [Chelativorans]|jgi:hypothetical protein|nr:MULTISPECIES: hypothetical protein [Chelativorans]
MRSRLTGSAGTVEVSTGDRFHADGVEWEIVGFTGESIYSPSNIGGTPIVRCRAHPETPPFWARWEEADGTVEWCGDSIASAIIRGRAALKMEGRDG